METGASVEDVVDSRYMNIERRASDNKCVSRYVALGQPSAFILKMRHNVYIRGRRRDNTSQGRGEKGSCAN